MTSKNELRKKLETEMAAFLARGGEIKKVSAIKPTNKTTYKAKEKVVEIEVDHLPEALRKKHFGE